MIKESKKFPAVMTTQSVLGIEEGTVLRFDWASGKYVSVVEHEDIADDYYYSGYAIAIDPYIVKDNIGVYFTHIEQEPEVAVIPEEIMKEDKPEAQIQYSNDEEYTKVHALVIDCNCGNRMLLQTMQAPGLNITLMAEDESSFVELTCPECESSLTLRFAPENEVANEFTEKESY